LVFFWKRYTEIRRENKVIGGEKVISKTAVVETDAIGSGTRIGDFAVVRAGVRLGQNVLVHPHVVIEPGVVVGDGVEIFPFAYLGREPKGAGTLARQPEFEKVITIGAECSVGANAVIYYDVSVEENTLIGDGASIREQCRIGSRCIVARDVTINYNTKIGDRTKIMDSTHITGNCVIGNDVFISVLVGTTNDNAMGGEGYSEELVLGPTVEDGAMVGAKANLLPGVVVGRDAIVGAGALVTRPVEPETIVMGVPARVVRRVEKR
jgi:acetyltransferase-like isoleucine patch superfamily enzyme